MKSIRNKLLGKVLPFIAVIACAPVAYGQTTVNEVINNMTTNTQSEMLPKWVEGQYWEWQKHSVVDTYAPHTSALASWYDGRRPEGGWLYDFLTWYQIFEGKDNTATNTRVQVKNLRMYFLSQSTRKWTQVDLVTAPSVDIWKYKFDHARSAQNPTDYRLESSTNGGGVAVRTSYPEFIHGYGDDTKYLPNPQDVRATYVAMEFRLVVDNPNLPDDRANAKYIVNAGADWYPGDGGGWNSYAPAIGQSKFLLATNEWRTAAMLVPNTMPGYMPADSNRVATAAAWDELRTNPPNDPLLTGGGGGGGTVPPPSGATTIVAKHSNKCVDVPASNTTDGVVVNQYSCNNPASNNQLFTFKDMGQSRYEIIASHSGKCLEVQNGSTADYTAIQQSTCTGSTQQLWTQRIAADGYVELVSVVSNKCLDVTGHSTGDSVPLQQWTCTGEPHQSFKLTGQRTSHELIAKHSGKCMDVAANSSSNGAEIHQYACEGNANQKWTLNDRGNGFYDIRAQHSGKCLDTNNMTADGSALQQYDCVGGARQLWKLRPMPGGYYELESSLSGKCVDVKAISTANSAIVQQYNCAETSDNQLWYIK